MRGVQMERTARREDAVDIGEPLGVGALEIRIVGAEGFDLGHGGRRQF